MARNKTALKALVLAGALMLPVAGVAYANTVKVSVSVAAVASVDVETEERNGEILYTAYVSTNSTNGFDLYVSENGEDWDVIKTVDHYPTDEEKVVTSTSTKPDLKFKAEPRK